MRQAAANVALAGDGIRFFKASEVVAVRQTSDADISNPSVADRKASRWCAIEAMDSGNARMLITATGRGINIII